MLLLILEMKGVGEEERKDGVRKRIAEQSAGIGTSSQP